MPEGSNDSICISKAVTLPAEEAFELFTAGLSSWYPRIYTWSGDGLESIAIEPGAGGHCFEIGPHGFRCDWGRVLVWEPPRKLVFSWQISFSRAPVPDPRAASEIEVLWTPRSDGGTDMDFCHRHFSRHGDEGHSYREAMASEGGWPFILDRYLAKAAS